ncbi:MAG: hypothetical protein WC824_09355 [Bacteroidota bacterium]|jgi:hypothetical protein
MKGITLTLGLCLFLAGCSEPEGPDPLPPIKEKFEWRLDTIKSPGAWQFRLNDVFGTGDGTVYVAAMGNGGWRGMLWKYTDSSWTPIELNRKYGGPLDGEVWFVGDLDGTDGKRLWMAGSRHRDSLYYPVKLAYGFLASYDGQSFKEVDLFYEPELNCLDVVTDNDIWFGCRGPWIYHYDGARVRKFELPMERIEALSEYPIEFISVSEIASVSDEVIVAVYLSYDRYGGGMVQLKFKNKTEWEIADYRTGARMSWSGGMEGFCTSKEGTLYSGGDYVYRYVHGEWNKLHWTVHLMHRIFGSSDRDIWAVGVLNNVVRCVDGKWISNEFFRIPDAHKTTTWIGGWTDGNTVFIVGNPDDGMDFGVVAHGK